MRGMMGVQLGLIWIIGLDVRVQYVVRSESGTALLRSKWGTSTFHEMREENGQLVLGSTLNSQRVLVSKGE